MARQPKVKACPKVQNKAMTSLPNMLTLSRIGIIPLLILLFYLDRAIWRPGARCGLFAIAGITDYFDGYLARHRKQVSAFGRFLDPIADKLLVAAVLLMLVATQRVEGLVILPALVILCREILVSGLREYLAEIRSRSRSAAWPSGRPSIQMVALGFLIVGDGRPRRSCQPN